MSIVMVTDIFIFAIVVIGIINVLSIWCKNVKM